MSLYEWSLEVHKVNQRRKKEHFEWEGQAYLAREILATIYNTAGKSYKRTFDSKEFIKLSLDQEIKKEPRETREMTKEEIESKFGKHLKK